MFDFDMLVEGAFRPVRFLAGFDGASVVPFDFTGSPPEALFAVILCFFSTVDLITLLLELGEPGDELILFIEELPELGEQYCFCEV